MVLNDIDIATFDVKKEFSMLKLSVHAPWNNTETPLDTLVSERKTHSKH